MKTEMPKNDKEYFAHPNISNSDIKLINRSINHFLYRKAHPEKTAAMTFGSAFHCYILEPKEFDKRFIINKFESRRTKEYKQWAEFNNDKEIITQDEFQTLQEMKQALIENAEVRKLFNIDINFNFQDKYEVEKIHLFNFMGVGCKCKTDYESRQRDMIIDIKTCQKVEDNNEATKIIIDYDYFQQSVLYQLGYSLDYKCQKPMFFIVFIEKEAPYGIRIKYIDNEFERVGLAQIKQGLWKWKNYLDNRNNPDEYWGYVANPSAALCPNWLKAKYI